MKEIICTTQAELDAVAADFDGRVIIKFGTPYNRAVVNRRMATAASWRMATVSVVAYGNSQVVDATRRSNIKISGNARIVYNPSSIDEYIDFYGLDATDTTVKLYKAVHFCKGIYCADYDSAFTYAIGKTVEPNNGFSDDANIECGAGIHLTHKAWAISYGANWSDLAILECECEKDDVLVPLYSGGKVRARKVQVLREVPLEECGLYGKMLAKRRANK